jgi:AcrR family transcriptional regulator
MTESSHLSRQLRRQPKQQRGKQRVAKILDAAARVFDRVGYDAATTHLIAAEAGTAIGSLYQFFPDKAAIFKAMEIRHVERVKQMWAEIDIPTIVQLPLQVMVHSLVVAVGNLFEHPVSRVVFMQFFLARQIFQTIDDSFTQEAINFMASILKHRQPNLSSAQIDILAEVCVHSSNALILASLRCPDLERRQLLTAEIEALMVAYLSPHMNSPCADSVGWDSHHHQHVMKVMMCPRCDSQHLSRNGSRRGKQCYICKDCGRQFV